MSPDAIVIGAGCAGLSAATALAERGARVLVLEARPALGGRASVVRDPATGEKLDNGQHVLVGGYAATLDFLRRIGSAGRLRWQAGLSVTMIERDGRRSTLALPPLPSPLHLLAGVLAWDALSWRDTLSVLRVGIALRSGSSGTHRRVATSGEGAGEAAPPTVRDWLARQAQAPRLIELFWEPLALAALNQPIDLAAVDTFLEVLSRMFGPEASDASLVIPAVPLDELYAEPARQWLGARGSEVRTRAPAKVRVEGGRAAGVEVRGERIDAPIVIASVPWFGLPGLFDDPPAGVASLLQHARETSASPIVTVNLWYDRPVLDDLLVGLPGRVFQWVFDKGQAFGRSSSHLSLVSSGAAGILAKSNDELVAVGRREVESALPRARAAVLRHGSAVRERFATFSLAPDQPPRPGTRTAIEGLLLASDWVDTGLPATIESGVLAGQWAADAAREGS